MNILAILFILAMIPSVLPTWRSTLIVASILYMLLMVACFWSIQQISTMTRGEGPAFFGIVLTYGFAECILVCSCLFKAFIAFILSRLKPATTMRLQRIVVRIALFVTFLSAYAVFARGMPPALAIVIGAIFAWLSLVTWVCASGKPTEPATTTSKARHEAPCNPYRRDDNLPPLRNH
jgi:hypothetical protein